MSKAELISQIAAWLVGSAAASLLAMWLQPPFYAALAMGAVSMAIFGIYFRRPA